MKLHQILETVSDTPASKEDLEWSVAKIKEAKKEIDEIAKKEKYDPSKYTKAADKREAERWQSICKTAHKRMDFAIELHEKIIPEFNKIKAAANKAASAKDVETLKKCHQEFKDLVIKHDLIKISKWVVHRDLTRLKVEKDYPRKIYDAIQWILHVRDHTPKLILQAGRTDAENAKAAKSSASMKARWGSMS